MTSPSRALSVQAFEDPELCRGLLDALRRELDGPLRFMEVCGTHTVAIFRSGLRSVLPQEVTHLSGPGCPVCVTHHREVEAFLLLAQQPRVTIATFGDVMRVPGVGGRNLKEAQASGASVSIVYSPLDALQLALAQPEREVVFLGVGFETTAPTVAATIQMAQQKEVKNFSVLSMHKLVPPVLDALLASSEPGNISEPAKTPGNVPESESAGPKKRQPEGIDAFLLPGHVSTILGIAPFAFMAEKYGKPGVIGGFAPADILQSLLLMVRMRKQGIPAIMNQYSRAVSDEGNPKAGKILFSVFQTADAVWRGLGTIPGSGLAVCEEYAQFDAWKRFGLALPDVPDIPGCRCGSVLQGVMPPPECPLFGTACTPARPVGPCMVSTEGSCAAYYAYSM